MIIINSMSLLERSCPKKTVLQSDLFCARRHAVCRPMLAGLKSSSTVRIQVCRGRPRGLFQVAGTPLIDTGAHDYMVHVYLASALEACSRRCPIQYFTCNVAAWKTRLCVFGGLCVDMWRLVHQWSFLLFWLSFDCFWRLVHWCTKTVPTVYQQWTKIDTMFTPISSKNIHPTHRCNFEWPWTSWSDLQNFS